MKTRTLSLIIISLLLGFSSLKAQSIYGLQELSHEVDKIKMSEAGRQNANIEGTPYLNDEFSAGNVVVNDSTTYKDIPLRYNAYSDQMEFKHNNGTVLILDNASAFKEIDLSNQRFIYKSLSVEKREVRGFFEIITEGKVKLLKKYTVDLTDPVPAKPFADPIPAKYIFKPESYYLVKDEKAMSVSNEKSLLENLNDQGELAAFIKKNKLKTRKEDDLIEMVKFYNSAK